MKINMKRNNGITLIALVITVIVLLILAAVSISYGIGNGGIIKKAQDASEKQRLTEIVEEINYVFAKQSTAKSSVDMLDFLNDLSDPEGNKQNEKLKEYEIIQHADDIEKFDVVIEWQSDDDKKSNWFKLEKNRRDVYEVSESYGENKPNNLNSTIIKAEFYSDKKLIKTKRVIKGNPIGKLPTVVKDSYNFEGWYTEEDGGTLVSEKTLTPISQDKVEYYASWVVNAINKNNIDAKLPDESPDEPNDELEEKLEEKIFTYNREEIKPVPIVKYNGIKLREGIDYSVVYDADTINVGTKNVRVQQVEGRSRYDFKENLEYQIICKSIKELSIELNKTTYEYDGKEKKPSATIKYGDYVLKEGTEYTMTYTNNIKAGTATVSITGIGNYCDSVSKTFTIEQANNPMTVTSSQVWEIVFSTAIQKNSNLELPKNNIGTVSYSIKSQINKNSSKVSYFYLESGSKLCMKANTPVNESKYIVEITANDPGDSNYKLKSIDFIVTVTVKQAENSMNFSGSKNWTVHSNNNTASCDIPKATETIGNVSYKIEKQIDKNDSPVSYFSIANGPKLSVKANTPASGSKYTVIIAATAAGNSNYKSITKTITYTVNVDVEIIFNANGGSNSKTVYLNYGTELKGSIPNVEKKGYSFIGWFTEKGDGKGTVISEKTKALESKEYFAHWKLITYKIQLVPAWAAGFGRIVTSYGVDDTNQAHIGNYYFATNSETFSKVYLEKGHHYTLRGGPFCNTNIYGLKTTISAGSNISYTCDVAQQNATPGSAFCKLFKNYAYTEWVTPEITTSRAVKYNQFAVSMLALYDITNTPHLNINNSTADVFILEYTVEDNTFSVPNMIQPDGNGGTRTCYWLRNNVKVQDVTISHGSVGDITLFHGGS